MGEIIKRYELFINSLGYTKDNYKNASENLFLKYIKFTSDREQEYIKEKNIRFIYDFEDFDNYCIEWLLREGGNR